VVGALNGIIITKGRMQPFIVTLAMMVGILGVARLVTGQDASVVPVYAGTNSTQDVDMLRALLWRVLPIPGLFFLAAALVFGLVLRTTTFGRYIYAMGGNEQATRLSGIAVDRVKIAVYALSGMLASLAGVLYTAQYLQGKPDAGEGIELDAIAAVVIGGTSLMGGRGSMAGTLVGVLIFGFLGNILQLNNIDSNTQLVLKGAIILGAVLLQEGQAGPLGHRLRSLFGRSARPVAGVADPAAPGATTKDR
jgi:simple sugar transport system permease protein